jgi:hypothetical protein
MHKHASKKEARRCDELTIMEKQGLIKDLKQQPRINVLLPFRYKGKAIRGIDYIADFGYFDNDKKCFVIEDTKGYKTPVYQIKKKMLLNVMKTREDFLFIES